MISQAVITGGSFYHMALGRSKGEASLELLAKSAAPAAFHNSGERFDPPKCHPNTRIAVLRKIMNWITSQDARTRDKLILWLKGPAGSGKSAIGQTIAEKCEAERRLLATFFFGRSDPRRNHLKPLMPTIAYQVYTHISQTQNRIISVIDNDPLIFNRSPLVQFESLIINPLRELINSGHHPDLCSRRLIVIDGLDECCNRREQQEILLTIFHFVKYVDFPVQFLITSRPEQEITFAFDMAENRNIHSQISLDGDFSSDGDILCFLISEFKVIKESHPLRHLLPTHWPKDEVIRKLVIKSSGQFIYPSTVIKYLKSPRHRPDHRLEIIQNLRTQTHDCDMPFAELDALYAHVLSSATDISMVLHVLSFWMYQQHEPTDLPTVAVIEKLFSLESGTIETLFCDLKGLVELRARKHGEYIRVLHASLQDFLLDPLRSKHFHMDRKYAMTRHARSCFTFISSQRHPTDVLVVAMKFVKRNQQYIDWTEDLVNELGPSAVFAMYRLRVGIGSEYYAQSYSIRYLKAKFIPCLLSCLSRYGLQRQYLLYRHYLDQAYLELVALYLLNSVLCLKLAVAANCAFLPRASLKFDWSYACLSGDSLEITDSWSSVGPDIKPQCVLLAEFLHDQERSKHVSLKVIGPTLYAHAALVCFRVLGHAVNLNQGEDLPESNDNGRENVDESPNLDVAIFSEMHNYLNS